MIKVIIDYREKSSKVAKGLENYDVRIEVRRLPIGDYVVSDRVVVERKTMQDFCSSIIDGRLFKQAEKLGEYEKPIILITEGEITLPPSSYLGAISSLILDYGISVVVLHEEFASGFIYRLAYREQSSRKSVPAVRNFKPEGLRERQIYLLSGLPGVNRGLAERILEEFCTPLNFFNSSEKHRVRGLGVKKIKRIEETLTRGDSHGCGKKNR